MATNQQKLMVGAGSVQTDVATTSGNFYDLGGYRDSLSVRFSEERFNLEVADHLCYVKSVRTRLDCFVNTSLVEATHESLINAIGTTIGSIPITAATSMSLQITEPGVSAMKFIGGTAGSPTTFDLVSYIFSQCVPMTDAELTYAKDGETLIPISYMVLGTITGANASFGWSNQSTSI
jgi:hypothetical protein